MESAIDDRTLIESLRAIVGAAHVLADPNTTRRRRTGFRFGCGEVVTIAKGADCLALEEKMWEGLDKRGTEYPAEHDVGHLITPSWR